MFGTEEVRGSVGGDMCSKNNMGPDLVRLMGNYQTFSLISGKGRYRSKRVT